jgi:hypothetical protein
VTQHTVIEGRVSDVIRRDEADQYVIPEAARHEFHIGEELGIVDPAPEHWTRSIPNPAALVADTVVSLLPKSIRPPSSPVVIAPSGTLAVGEDVSLAVEPVLDYDVPAHSGEIVTYRLVDSPTPDAGGGSESYSDQEFTGGDPA